MVAGVRVVFPQGDTHGLTGELAKKYLAQALEVRPEYAQTVHALTVTFDGDDALLDYQLNLPKFERIRRITGYLVGSTDRWNCGKVAELEDRVSHANA